MSYEFEAIKTKKAATSALNSLNGPYLGFAPDRQPFPYLCVVMHDTRGNVEYTFRDLLFETSYVRFIIVDDDASTVRTWANAVEAAFNAQPTTISTSSGSILSVMRMTPWVIKQNPLVKTASGVPGYQGVAEFKFVHQP